MAQHERRALNCVRGGQISVDEVLDAVADAKDIPEQRRAPLRLRTQEGLDKERSDLAAVGVRRRRGSSLTEQDGEPGEEVQETSNDVVQQLLLSRLALPQRLQERHLKEPPRGLSLFFRRGQSVQARQCGRDAKAIGQPRPCCMGLLEAPKRGKQFLRILCDAAWAERGTNLRSKLAHELRRHSDASLPHAPQGGHRRVERHFAGNLRRCIQHLRKVVLAPSRDEHLGGRAPHLQRRIRTGNEDAPSVRNPIHEVA
mmetsp:Transcript_74769/g.207911  ORF Transcript_74769/g.207911 Transcript_74769/m.207911 type:complete len:256 (-) Transcript_74769:2616-3383(-)